MLLLFRRISIPEFRKHFLRYFLTFLGVFLGVAIFCSTRAATSSLTSALRDTIDRIAGKASLQVTAGEVGVPEAALETARAVLGVRLAVPIIEVVATTSDPSQGNLLVLGVDLANDRGLRDYAMVQAEVVSDPLTFLAQPDSLIVSEEFARRNGLAEGDPIRLTSPVGTKAFTVRGLMASAGVGRAFGGNVAVMDVYSAQFVFNRAATFDRIDVVLADGVRVDDLRARLRQALGAGVKVEPPLRRGKQTESLIDAFALALFLSSVMSLLVGVFLIFNVFAVSVSQRRTQIGILRALGVSRWQMQGLLLAEAALLGVAGSGLGLLGGIVLGRGMLILMAAIVRQTYGVHVSVDRLWIDPLSVAVSLALGIAASLAGAFLPARAAAGIDPALALRKGTFQVLYLGESWRRRWIGALLVAISTILQSFAPSRHLLVQLAELGMLFAGLTLLVPTFSHSLARVLRKPVTRIFGIEGRFAADSLLQAPRRTSGTVAALMYSLAFIVSSASLSSSVKASLLRWVDSAINPDLLVSASESLMSRPFPFPEELGEQLRRIPGVRQVDSLRVVSLDYDRRAPLLLSLEIDQYLERAKPLLEEGDSDSLVASMLDRNAVLVSNNFARLHGVGRGDRIALDTPSGPQDFRVVGVQVDYTSENGTLFVDRRTYKRLWQDSRVDTFELMVEPGRDPDRVKEEVERRLAGGRAVFVLTNKAFRGEVVRLANQFWVLTYVQTLVAVAVGVLGIVNSLTVSITERRREIGILRALGGERWRVRRSILLEAMVMGSVALALGTSIGSTLGQYVISIVSGSVTGWTFPYQFPTAVALLLVPGALTLCVAAAWYPSTLAVRTPIVEAVAYE
jgi:putative ABC transport system permease protein